MNKKLVTVLSLLLSIGVFISGCSNKAENKSVPTVEKKQYEVSNTGGTFSQKDLIYFVMTDRFNNGDKSNDKDVNVDDPKAFHGGDLKGVTEKLDYIKSLGATALWITPVEQNQAGGYHGYWITDFKKVDNHLGTMDDLQTLVKTAHSKGIKVLLDFVVNHTGYETPWLKDEKYKNWFHPKFEVTNWQDQEQVEKGWLAGLPDLDQDNPETRKYLIDIALWWIQQTGIDGFRLDTVKHVSKDFWNEFSYRIKSKYPNFYLLGEVFDGNVSYVEGYHKAGIDGMTNFPLYYGIKDTFKPAGNAMRLVSAIRGQSDFSTPAINGNFIDNHDVKRLMSEGGGNTEERLMQALAFIMTYPGIPVIYYGTEIAMIGGDDPGNRRDMEWDKTDASPTLQYYRKLSALRSTVPALTTGSFKLLDSDLNYIVYSRGEGSESIFIIMNVSDEKSSISVNMASSLTELTDLITGKNYTIKDGNLNVELAPSETLILKAK